MEKKDLKIVFLGTPEFAVESLDRLVRGGYNVAAAITMPDKPAGRGHKMFQSPVKLYAQEHGIRVLQPANLKDEAFQSELREINADLFIVIAFRMLPEAVWRMPRLGTFNLHASLLPRYRGAAPINWAIINGDNRTGVTTFFLKHEIDTGDILRQESVEILPEDNAESLHDKLMRLGADLTIDTVEHILAGDLKPLPQEELAGDIEPAPAPKIFKETCRIDWSQPAEKIHNLVRGLSPYPAAWTELLDTQFKIFETRAEDSTKQEFGMENSQKPRLQPGEVKAGGGKMIVGCGEGTALEILELQPQGKKRMAAGDYLRGRR
ncbi:MAG: methionyl-tRNA formyltransferase [Clostridium sp.]|nr:methionyl-tRNA formyltransferase [Clostridium sp.]